MLNLIASRFFSPASVHLETETVESSLGRELRLKVSGRDLDQIDASVRSAVEEQVVGPGFAGRVVVAMLPSHCPDNRAARAQRMRLQRGLRSRLKRQGLTETHLVVEYERWR